MMSEDKRMKISSEYYELVSQKSLSNAEELRLLEILESAAEDFDLCLLLSEIDERILSASEDLDVEHDEPIVVDVEKIMDFISLYNPEDDDLTLVRETSPSDILIGYIQNVVSSNPPTEVLRTFQRLFIQDGESYPVTKVSQALKALLTMEDSARTFSQTLYECIYIPVNYWFTKPDAQISITKLIDTFDQRAILKVSSKISASLCSSLMAFSQSDYFIKLFRLGNCIRHQVFYQFNNSEESALSLTNTLTDESPLDRGDDNHSILPLKTPQVSQDGQAVIEPFAVVKPKVDVGPRVQVNLVPRKTSVATLEHHKKAVFPLIRAIKGVVLSLQSRVQWDSDEQSTRRNCRLEKLYKLPPSTQEELLRIAVVDEPIRSGMTGRVKLKGTYWKAKLDSSYASCSLQPGQRVIPIYREGLTLIVKPHEAEAIVKLPNVKKITYIGVVESIVCPGMPGRVSFNGNSWRAELHDGFPFNTLYPGETVKVAFLCGNSLIVAPLVSPAKPQVQTVSNTVNPPFAVVV